MNRRESLCVGLGLASLAAGTSTVRPGPGAAAPTPRARIGINLSGPADWNTELPFANVFRLSRPWVSQREGARFGQGPPLDLTPEGWVRRLEPGCWAEALLCTIPDGHYPGGVYNVLYEGSGRIEFGSNARVVDTAPGRFRIRVDSSREIISVRLKQTDPADPVRSIRVVMPGAERSWPANPFTGAFLERWRGMACVRFMDWMETNGSRVERWADRPRPEHATYSGRGVPVETMVDYSNRAGVDPWFCMPHRADDDYVTRFAQAVRERLDPARKVHVEYSNEVWNGQFAQAKYAGERGVALGLGTRSKPWEAAWRFTARRSVEIFRIWERVFGGPERLVRILPAQSGVTAVCETVCGFEDAYRHADALAIAPYMGYTLGRGELKDHGPIAANWGVDRLLDDFEARAFPDSVARMKASKAVADRFGLRLVAYEGGQHMVALTPDRKLNERLSALFMEANRHPRMGEIYTRYYDAWERAGGDLFATFASVAKWSVHGCWGLAEYADEPPQRCPKLRATLEWARRRGGQPVSVV